MPSTATQQQATTEQYATFTEHQLDAMALRGDEQAGQAIVQRALAGLDLIRDDLGDYDDGTEPVGLASDPWAGGGQISVAQAAKYWRDNEVEEHVSRLCERNPYM